MQHFIVEITYTVPFPEIEKVVPAHRAFLQGGYDRQLLLFSGPQSPKVGGVVVARAESLEAIQTFFADDPYRLANVASYRFVEFTPVKFQPLVADWVG